MLLPQTLKTCSGRSNSIPPRNVEIKVVDIKQSASGKSFAESLWLISEQPKSKNLSWVRTLAMSLFFLNAVVQLLLGNVFFQTLNIWSKVGDAVTCVGWGIGFWFLSMRFQNWRCTKCKLFW